MNIIWNVVFYSHEKKQERKRSKIHDRRLIIPAAITRIKHENLEESEESKMVITEDSIKPPKNKNKKPLDCTENSWCNENDTIHTAISKPSLSEIDDDDNEILEGGRRGSNFFFATVEDDLVNNDMLEESDEEI